MKKLILSLITVLLTQNVHAYILNMNTLVDSNECQGNLVNAMSVQFSNDFGGGCGGSDNPHEGDLTKVYIGSVFYPVAGAKYKLTVKLYDENGLVKTDSFNGDSPQGYQITPGGYVRIEDKALPNFTYATIDLYQDGSFVCADYIDVNTDNRYIRE